MVIMEKKERKEEIETSKSQMEWTKEESLFSHQQVVILVLSIYFFLHSTAA